MAVRRNAALAKLRAGGAVFGPALIYGSVDLAEQVALLGFDFVWLDWQHGENDEATLRNQVARFRGLDTIPLPRVQWNEPGTIGRTLDTGAMGVIVPMIETPEEAAAAVQATFYPPKGRRSGGGVRLGLLAASEDEYLRRGSDEIMLVVMVESEAAIGRIDAIMKVPGVDVVLIGPGDLMLDLESRGKGAAEHERLCLEVARAARAHGVAAGYVCGSAEIARRRLEQGFRFINWGLDHHCVVEGLGRVLATCRSWTAG